MLQSPGGPSAAAPLNSRTLRNEMNVMTGLKAAGRFLEAQKPRSGHSIQETKMDVRCRGHWQAASEGRTTGKEVM